MLYRADPLFYQSPDSYGEGDDRFEHDAGDIRGATPVVARKPISVMSTSLSESESQPPTFSPGHMLHLSETNDSEDLLSPQTPDQKLSPSGSSGMRKRFAFAGGHDHDLSTSNLNVNEVSMSHSKSSPMRFLAHSTPDTAKKKLNHISSAQETQSSEQLEGTEDLLRLKIPRLSKGVFAAMKAAADMVLNGGSPEVEIVIDEGMSFPTNDFRKVVGTLCNSFLELIVRTVFVFSLLACAYFKI